LHYPSSLATSRYIAFINHNLLTGSTSLFLNNLKSTVITSNYIQYSWLTSLHYPSHALPLHIVVIQLIRTFLVYSNCAGSTFQFLPLHIQYTLPASGLAPGGKHGATRRCIRILEIPEFPASRSPDSL